MGNIDSRTQSSKAHPDITNVRHLSIGANYKGSSAQLYGCCNDARAHCTFVHERFSNTDVNKLGLVMTDDTSSVKSFYYPNRANIIRAIKWLFSSATLEQFTDPSSSPSTWPKMKEGTYVYCSYAVHGSQVRDIGGDEEDNLDETICPSSSYGGVDKMITDDEIVRMVNLRLIEKCSVVVLMDCCHSGNLKYYLSRIGTKSFSNYPETICPVILISACRDNQLAGEAHQDRKPGGAATINYLNAMSTLSAKPGIVELCTYIS
jgi:hypothetical protein